jgi:hypothetical protein
VKSYETTLAALPDEAGAHGKASEYDKGELPQ